MKKLLLVMLVPVLVFIGVMGCDTFDPGIQTDYLMQGTWFNEEGWAITITPSILTVNYNDEVVQSYWTEFSYIGDRGADAKKFSADITIYSYDKKVEIATFQADYSESTDGKSLKISKFELADEYYYDKILRPPNGTYTSVAPEGGGPGPGPGSGGGDDDIYKSLPSLVIDTDSDVWAWRADDPQGTAPYLKGRIDVETTDAIKAYVGGIVKIIWTCTPSIGAGWGIGKFGDLNLSTEEAGTAGEIILEIDDLVPIATGTNEGQLDLNNWHDDLKIIKLEFYEKK